MSGDCPVCREIGKPDGSCSPWCRDVVEVERERDALRAEVERLRRGIEAYREFMRQWRKGESWWAYEQAIAKWERVEGR